MKRDEHLHSIRPKLDVEDDLSLPEEVFQNEVIRPVIKFQSEALFAMMNEYIRRLSPDFRTYDLVRKRKFISSAIQKDHTLHHQLIGMVVACFTLEELQHFLQQRSEHSKRISQILTERFCSQAEKLG